MNFSSTWEHKRSLQKPKRATIAIFDQIEGILCFLLKSWINLAPFANAMYHDLNVSV